jgi:hypothetical protein
MDMTLMGFVIEGCEGIRMGCFFGVQNEIDMKFCSPLTIAMDSFCPQSIFLGNAQPS